MKKILYILFLLPLFLSAQESGFHGYGDVIRAQEINSDTFELRIVFTGGNTIEGQYLVDSLKIGDKIFSSCAPYTVVSISLQTSGIGIFRISDPYNKGMPVLGSRCAVYRETTNKNLVRTNISNAMNYGISPNELNCLTQNLISQLDTLMTAEEITLWTQIERSDTTGAIAIAGVDSVGAWSDSLRFWQGKLRIGLDTAATLADVRTLGFNETGTANTLPIWATSSTLGDSWLSQGSGALSLADTRVMRFIGHTTAGRPTGLAGHFGFNTSNSKFEYHDGSGWFNLGDNLANTDLTLSATRTHAIAGNNLTFSTTGKASAFAIEGSTGNVAIGTGTFAGALNILGNIGTNIGSTNLLIGTSMFPSWSSGTVNFLYGSSNGTSITSSNKVFVFGTGNLTQATSTSNALIFGTGNFNGTASVNNSAAIGESNFGALTSLNYSFALGANNYQNTTTSTFGFSAGFSNFISATTVNYTTGLGQRNFNTRTSGDYLFGFGFQNNQNGSTGSYWTLFGQSNGRAATSGNYVFLAGNQNLSSATSINNVVAFGNTVFEGSTGAADHTFTSGNTVGGGSADMSPTNTIGIGSQALRFATSLDDQIALGYQAGISNAYTRGIHIGRLSNSKRNNEISLGSTQYSYGRWDFTGQVRMATGTTAQRLTAEIGDFRANSSNLDFEGYSGAEWKRFAWYNATNLDVGNYSFNIDQTVGAGQDNYILTYDDASGEIGLEAATGGAGDDWGADVVNHDGTLTGDGTSGTPLKVDTSIVATTLALNDSIANALAANPDTNWGISDITFTGDRTHALGSNTLTIDATAANDVLVIEGSTGDVGILGLPVGGAALAVGGTESMIIPSGTTAQEPTPQTGMIRHDATKQAMTGYQDSDFRPMVQTFEMVSTTTGATIVVYKNTFLYCDITTTSQTITLDPTDLSDGSVVKIFITDQNDLTLDSDTGSFFATVGGFAATQVCTEGVYEVVWDGTNWFFYKIS